MKITIPSFSKRTPTNLVNRGSAAISWQQPPIRQYNYENIAREGYSKNEMVFACIEEICSSAAEPHFAVMMNGEKKYKHPVLDLLNKPNPFMTRYYYVSSVLMYRQLAGNSYTEKVYSNGGKLSQLWLLRPDRVEVIRDPVKYIAGYKYGYGPWTIDYPVDEIMHSKNRNPLDSYYGMGQMQVLLSRVDTDNFMREYTKAFFFNAAVPAGLINIKGVLDEQEKERMRSRNRAQFSGPDGWHSDMVIEGTEATYTPMGMPMGSRGIAYPELDEINEARIAMVFGVPLSLVEARLGVHGSSFAKKAEDRASFWDETLSPIYIDIAESLSHDLADDFDYDEIIFDTTTVRALQEDVDKKHIRVRADLGSGIISQREARVELGLPPKIPDDDIMLLASNITAQGPNEVPGPTDVYPAEPPKKPATEDPNPLTGPKKSSNGVHANGVHV